MELFFNLASMYILMKIIETAVKWCVVLLHFFVK